MSSVTAARAIETIGLASALLGLAIVPGFYVATGMPQAADYPARAWADHRRGGDLCLPPCGSFAEPTRNSAATGPSRWRFATSIELICSGPYAFVRHPMYTSFLLMGLGQAFLLSNWVAGLAGLIGFAILFFLRVDKEERMMLEIFGPQYRAYMDRTKRIIPYLY